MLRNSFKLLGIPLLMGTLGLGFTPAAAGSLVERPELQSFVDKMVKEHHFNGPRLMEMFKAVELQPNIIKAISRPAESKPWYEYRPIFMTQQRIEGGVAFWNANADTLARAEKKFGVPPEIVIAIIGVETLYGKHKGTYRVIDSLSTLAFDYPPRSRFFTSELEHYLLMTREEQVDPLSLKGSYAGAMGKTQFISSSYRHYAVDFDGDGHRDLWNNTEDAIGSVANYFKRHGWRTGQPITAPVKVTGKRYKELVEKGIKPKVTLAEFSRYGVDVPHSLGKQRLGALIELETKNGDEYWVGLQNFYVITRYNHSSLYAMAVYQLSQEIVKQRESSNVASQ